jgi:hypothetical protein
MGWLVGDGMPFAAFGSAGLGSSTPSRPPKGGVFNKKPVRMLPSNWASTFRFACPRNIFGWGFHRTLAIEISGKIGLEETGKVL